MLSTWKRSTPEPTRSSSQLSSSWNSTPSWKLPGHLGADSGCSGGHTGAPFPGSVTTGRCCHHGEMQPTQPPPGLLTPFRELRTMFWFRSVFFLLRLLYRSNLWTNTLTPKSLIKTDACFLPTMWYVILIQGKNRGHFLGFHCRWNLVSKKASSYSFFMCWFNYEDAHSEQTTLAFSAQGLWC